MAKFSHMYTIAFSLISATQDDSDVSPDMVRDALQERMRDLDRSTGGGEWLEAIGAPDDTYQEEA